MTLQRSMVRALEIAELEAAQNFGFKKDKSLLDIQLAIEVVITGEIDKRKFQIKHARAVLVLVFGCNLKKSASKKDLLVELASQIEKQPDKLREYDVSVAAAASGVAAMPAADASCGEDEDVASLLLKECIEEVKSGNYELGALEVAFVVLDVVREIDSSGDFDSDHSYGDISFVQYLFNAFSSKVTKRRNMEFLYKMAERVPAMINDRDLSREELRKAFKKHLDSQE